MDTIVAEHFALTPAIREHIENNLERLREVLPPSATVRVFLSEPSPHVFCTLLKVHAERQEIVVREDGSNLYQTVTAARECLMRRLKETRGRRVAQKRRAAHAQAV